MSVLENDVDILDWLDSTESIKKPEASNVIANVENLPVEDFVNGTCFEIDKDVLQTLLEKAVTVVPSRDMVPVLTNFQFNVQPGLLTITASNLDLSIVVSTTQVDVKVPGVEVFPAKTLLAIVREGHNGRVFIEVTPQGACIVIGSFACEIKQMSGRDYPPMDNLDTVVLEEFDRAEFLRAITAVKYALPGKDFSGQSGLRFINIKGSRFTACDGERFQQARVNTFRLNMQLPALSITPLVKMLNASDSETIEIGQTKNKIIIKLGTEIFYITKKSDVFPNVEQLWLRPALNNNQELVINRQGLLDALKQVKVATDTGSNVVGLVLKESKVVVVARDSTGNNATSSLPATWLGKPRSVVVSYQHLVDMLKAYPDDECKFLLGEDTKQRKSPVLLKHDDSGSMATCSQLTANTLGLTH